MASFAFDHIHLRSPNPEEAARFYEEKFGATVRQRVMHDGQPRVDLDLDGMALFISGTADPAYAAQGPGHRPLDHFGLTVRGMAATVAALKAKGVEFTMEPRSPRPGITIAFLRAPDGVLIELIDRG